MVEAFSSVAQSWLPPTSDSSPQLEPMTAHIVGNRSPAMMEVPDFLLETPKVGPVGI
jgi:hypothetical protein